MRTPIDPIHHCEGRTLQLIIQPAPDQFADDGMGGFLGGQHPRGLRALDALLGETTVDPFDDVVALTHLTQRGLRVFLQRPPTRPDLLRQPQAFQAPETAHLEYLERIGPAIGRGTHVDDPVLICIALKLAVKLRPAIRLDLTFDGTPDLDVIAHTKLAGHEFLRTTTHAFTDVIARDYQVLAVLRLAAHDDMDMGMFGVPVINRRPVELRAEIMLSLHHKIAREALQVRHFHRIIWRDDETKMVTVIGTALGEGFGIDFVLFRAEHLCLRAVLRDALAAQITQVGRQRCGPRAVLHHAGLDHHPTRSGGQKPVGMRARDTATPEGRATTSSSSLTSPPHAPSTLGCRQGLRDKGTCTLGARGTDASGTNPEIVVILHANARDVREMAVNRQKREPAGFKAPRTSQRVPKIRRNPPQNHPQPCRTSRLLSCLYATPSPSVPLHPSQSGTGSQKRTGMRHPVMVDPSSRPKRRGPMMKPVGQ
ncbi:VirD2 component relaxase [Acetobacter pomorum]|nr:VirD2 component relaxase [Acetobacter pomorum]